MKSLEKNVQYVKVQDISYDMNNPRGETEKQILSDPEFKKLVLSIKQYGILEPLIVKKDEENIDNFKLIDGERRLRAAVKAAEDNLEYKVPTLIAKDDMDGRILAYQVHMLRKNWGKAAETKSIKSVISDIKKETPKITEAELIKKVKEITAHKDHEISDFLKLIKYNDRVIEKVISKELNMSYLVQIESSFISPLRRRFPSLMKQFGEDELRNILIQKALNGLLGNTRFLMDHFKDVFNEKDKKEDAEGLISKFLNSSKESIVNIYEKYSKLRLPDNKQAKRIKKANKSQKVKQKINAKGEVFHYRKIKVTTQQQTTIKDIKKQIENISNKFSNEEYEYIIEAIYCLEMHCFKAATLMIWSCGISRILGYISRDLSKFNTATDTMVSMPKTVYKHFAKNFQKNVTDIESIRENSNDRHLLSYLVYEKIVSTTEFNKLHSSYKTRCDCAHPTDIILKVNEILSIFENVYDLILNNRKLQ